MAKTKSPQAQQPSKPEPLQTELKGFRCPSLVPTPVLVDGDCPDLLDPNGIAGRPKIKSIIRMRDGLQDADGPDVRITNVNGTKFDICGAEIAFAYKVSPIEVPLSIDEIRTLGHQLFKLEQGEIFDRAKMRLVELNQRRAIKHRQKGAYQKVMTPLRQEAKRMALLQELDNAEEPPAPNDGPDVEIGQEAGDGADIVAAIVDKA